LAGGSRGSGGSGLEALGVMLVSRHGWRISHPIHSP